MKYIVYFAGFSQASEALVLVPFIDKTRLLAAIGDLAHQLTSEEQRRNKHGPMLIYTHTHDDLGSYNVRKQRMMILTTDTKDLFTMDIFSDL